MQNDFEIITFHWLSPNIVRLSFQKMRPWDSYIKNLKLAFLQTISHLPHFHSKTMKSEKTGLALYSLSTLVANYELSPFSLLGTHHWSRNQHSTYQCNTFRAQFFLLKVFHFKKSGQNLLISVLQYFFCSLWFLLDSWPGLEFRSLSSWMLTWKSSRQSIYTAPGLFYSCPWCWVSVLLWAISLDIFTLRTLSFKEKDGLERRAEEFSSGCHQPWHISCPKQWPVFHDSWGQCPTQENLCGVNEWFLWPVSLFSGLSVNLSSLTSSLGTHSRLWGLPDFVAKGLVFLLLGSCLGLPF